jgi:hypothetical protein
MLKKYEKNEYDPFFKYLKLNNRNIFEKEKKQKFKIL